MNSELAVYRPNGLVASNLTTVRCGSSKVYSDMVYASGFAKPYISEPYDLDYIGCHASHHILSRGGRLVAYIPKATLDLSNSRKSVLRNARVLDHEPNDPLRPLLTDLLSKKVLSTDLRKNPILVHLKNDGTGYAQIYGEGYKARIIPVELLQQLMQMHINPTGMVDIAGQTMVRFSDEAGSTHIFYVCLILSMVL